MAGEDEQVVGVEGARDPAFGAGHGDAVVVDGHRGAETGEVRSGSLVGRGQGDDGVAGEGVPQGATGRIAAEGEQR